MFSIENKYNIDGKTFFVCVWVLSGDIWLGIPVNKEAVALHVLEYQVKYSAKQGCLEGPGRSNIKRSQIYYTCMQTM